jgi:hypothetical protein
MSQHEQVREIGPQQVERGRVGHVDRAVEKPLLLNAATASRVHQHGRQEHHSGVEVEHSSDYRDEQQAGHEQHHGRAREPL